MGKHICVCPDLCDESPACKLKRMPGDGGCPMGVFTFKGDGILVADESKCLVINGKSCISKNDSRLTHCESACQTCVKIAYNDEEAREIERRFKHIIAGRNREYFLNETYLGTEPHPLHCRKGEIRKIEDNRGFNKEEFGKVLVELRDKTKVIILEILFSYTAICRAVAPKFYDFIEPSKVVLGDNFSHIIMYASTKETYAAIKKEFGDISTPAIIVYFHGQKSNTFSLSEFVNSANYQKHSYNFLNWLREQKITGEWFDEEQRFASFKI